jgi:hypothetical protein
MPSQRCKPWFVNGLLSPPCRQCFGCNKSTDVAEMVSHIWLTIMVAASEPRGRVDIRVAVPDRSHRASDLSPRNVVLVGRIPTDPGSGEAPQSAGWVAAASMRRQDENNYEFLIRSASANPRQQWGTTRFLTLLGSWTLIRPATTTAAIPVARPPRAATPAGGHPEASIVPGMM